MKTRIGNTLSTGRTLIDHEQPNGSWLTIPDSGPYWLTAAEMQENDALVCAKAKRVLAPATKRSGPIVISF